MTILQIFNFERPIKSIRTTQDREFIARTDAKDTYEIIPYIERDNSLWFSFNRNGENLIRINSMFVVEVLYVLM